MACIRRPRQYTEYADWTQVRVQIEIFDASSYIETGSFSHADWLSGDGPEGLHVLADADRNTITYAFSDPNTAMAFKLRFG